MKKISLTVLVCRIHEIFYLKETYVFEKLFERYLSMSIISMTLALFRPED